MALTPTDEQAHAQGVVLEFRGEVTSAGCWLPRPPRRGPARLNADRYTRIPFHGVQVRAHVLAYQSFVGDVPYGWEVMHSCDNPPCFNPEHLTVGTHAENMAAMAERERSTRGRRVGAAAARAEATHCKRGHEFTPENTYSPPGHPERRRCRTCRSEGFRTWAAANRGGQR